MSKNWDSKGIKPFSKYVMDKMKVWNRYQCSHLNKMQCQQSGHDVKVQFRYVSYKHPEKILFFPNSIKKKKKESRTCSSRPERYFNNTGIEPIQNK